MSNRVLLGMSGGVDSSAAALVLLRAGYEVSGVTMMLHSGQEDGSCGSLREAEDAAAVCRMLGIPHRILDFSETFSRMVKDNFVSEYRCGRTEIYVMAGLVQTVPVQARVMILSFPFPSVTLAIIAGSGYNIFPAFHSVFAILFFFLTHLLRQ